MSELVKALIKARKHFQPIVKDKTNPHFKTKYASLDAVLNAVQPGLDAAGLAIMQTLEVIDNQSMLITELLHESGESKRSVYPLQNQVDPQKFGGSITYGRRFSLCAILSVVADEDDDGPTASDSKSRPAKQTSKPSPDLSQQIADLFHELGYQPHDASEFIRKHFDGKSKRAELSSDELLVLHKILSEQLDQEQHQVTSLGIKPRNLNVPETISPEELPNGGMLDDVGSYS